MTCKTAVAVWCVVMLALTVCASAAGPALHLTGWLAALLWVPALAAMGAMVHATARAIARANSD